MTDVIFSVIVDFFRMRPPLKVERNCGRHERRLIKAWAAAERASLDRLLVRVKAENLSEADALREMIYVGPRPRPFHEARELARARNSIGRLVGHWIQRPALRVADADREALARAFNEHGTVTVDGKTHRITGARAEDFSTFLEGVDGWRWELFEVVDTLAKHGEVEALHDLGSVVLDLYYIAAAISKKNLDDKRAAKMRKELRPPTNWEKTDAYIEAMLPGILNEYSGKGPQDRGHRHAARVLHPLLRRKSLLWTSSKGETIDVDALRKHLEKKPRFQNIFSSRWDTF